MMQIRNILVMVEHKCKCFNEMLVKEIRNNFRSVRVKYMITTTVMKSQSNCSDEEVHFDFILWLLMSVYTTASVRIILTFIAFKYIR